MKQNPQFPLRAIIAAGIGVILIIAAVLAGPLLLSAPQVVRIEPPDGAEMVNPQAPLRIEFSQPVQKDSLAAVLRIEPSVDLTIDMEGNSALVRPTGGLQYGAEYTLTVGAGVRNALGRATESAQTVRFRTAPYVTVREVSPADGSADVPLETLIMVEFNAPVVSAEAIAAAADDPRRAGELPQPLTLTAGSDPNPVNGVGRWLSPTRFGFSPEDGLRLATTYRVTLRADLTPDGAARMEQPVNWSFTTAAQLLVGTRPFDGETDVAADRPIEIRLHRDIDPASVGASFRLLDAGGAAVAGTVETFEGGVRFKPAAPLQRGVRYRAMLEPGVNTRTGAILNAKPFEWTFVVIGDLEVQQVEPAGDTRDVPVDIKRISVRFNHPVVPVVDVAGSGGLPVAATIEPLVQGVARWIDTSTFVFSPTVPLDSSTDYRVRVAAGLTDQTGGMLRNEYVWSFRTIDPAVNDVQPTSAYAAPTTPVTVTFNQAMDLASLRSALRVIRADNGAQVAGTIAVSGTSAIFRSDAPLERGVDYRVVIDAGARSARGNGVLDQPFSGSFRVAPLPALVMTDPAPGATFSPSAGGIRLIFSTPMDWDTVGRALVIEPKPTDVFTSSYETDFYIYSQFEPETEYRITVGAAARDLYGVALGQDATVTFRTGPREPFVGLIGAYRAGFYRAVNNVRVPLQWVNVPELDWRITRLTPEAAALLISSYEDWGSFSPLVSDLVSQGTQPLGGERNRGSVGFVEVGPLAPGVYYLELRAFGNLVDRQVMVVSPYALTVKRSADRLFVWAVDLATGQPVPGLEVRATTYRYDRDNSIDTPVNLGRTGADGVLVAPFDGQEYGTIFLWSSESGRTVTFTTSDWESGISPWNFGLMADYGPRTLVGSLLTDKPIYRPGQTVHVRGALRGIAVGAGQGQAERYVLPGVGDRAYVEVNDPEGSTIFSTTLTFSPFGTFTTDLPLAQGAPLGSYSMVARLGSPQGYLSDAPVVFGSFLVAEYRVPAFEVTLTPSTSDLLRGDPLNVAVQAAYFAGGAPSNAPVRWRLLSQPFYFSSDDAPNFSFFDTDDAYAWYAFRQDFMFGDLIADGEGTTDAQGRFTLTLPASVYDRPPTGNGPRTGSQVLTLDVEVTDVDGQVIASQATVTVHGGAFYIGLRPEGYVARAGQPQQVSIVTLTPQGDPAPNRTVDVEIYQREWYSVREQGADGRFYWTSAYTDTLVETRTTTTDAQGRGQVQFTPTKGGLYRLVGKGKDDAGRTVQTGAYTWAEGGNVFWGIDDSNRVDLIADKRLYKPGDTATILVTAPYPDMTALLTIERGSVIEHRTFTLQGTTGVLQVPIRDEYAPNVYAALTLIKAAGDGSNPDAPAAPDLRVGIVKLPVSTERQELTITLTPDKTQVGPRDTVTYTLKATDYTGKGVRAEVSLALVDKAVLTLADDPNPSLRQAFYEQRALGVFTSSPLTALVDRVTLRLQPGDKGGGGGLEAPLDVRRNFPDTAFWNPALVTADDGTAQFSVTLPDNLTTWRLTARAITADTLVGEQTVDIVASKPLLLRPTLPRALTVGDRPVLQAVVQNTTNAAIEATVQVTPNPALTVEGPLERRVNVPANGTVLVRWQASVNPTPGNADEAILTLRASGGGYDDAVEARVPLRFLTTAEATASAGQVLDQVVETVQLPPEKAAADARVELELTPSLVAGITRGVEQLARSPYLSSEATVSSFMPAAVAYRLLQQAGFDDPQLRATLERSLTVGVQRLSILQKIDGGWGWWSADESDPYLTAYAVQGLVEAQRAGFTVDPAMLDRAMVFLTEALDAAPSLRSPLSDPNTRVYVLFVLGEAGKPDRGRAVNLYNERSALNVAGKAYLLMTLQAAGSEESRIRTLIAELMGSAVLTTSDAHWEVSGMSLWALDSDVTATGLALRSLLRTDPQNFLIPGAARWLMGERERDIWRTTYDSAGAVLALAEYAAQTGDLQADYRYRVALDGRTIREAVVSPATLRETDRVTIASVDLKPGGSQVLLQRQAAADQSGKGRLYYTLRMRYREDAAGAQALDRGFGVRREYIAVASDTLSPTGQLITQARQGDLVQVRITLSIPADVRYLTVEDFLPGGLEALDTSLKTTTAAVRDAELMPEGEEQPYWWHFGHTEVRAGRVALFATDLPKGTYTYTYLARATVPGIYAAPPATVYRTYAPEEFGRSAGASFTVVAP
ncbi:Ig-like domain-containing protein [Roseiflexus castenholzii]|uniref:Ig-like domain-containing protein n=1 Tax=Roseiflexus castenholzii TaxID=120962 RepID=UPI003C7C8D8E